MISLPGRGSLKTLFGTMGLLHPQSVPGLGFLGLQRPILDLDLQALAPHSNTKDLTAFLEFPVMPQNRSWRKMKKAGDQRDMNLQPSGLTEGSLYHLSQHHWPCCAKAWTLDSWKKCRCFGRSWIQIWQDLFSAAPTEALTWGNHLFKPFSHYLTNQVQRWSLVKLFHRSIRL